MANELLVLGASEVRELFDWDTAIASQRSAFSELGRGGASLAEKVHLSSRGASGDDLALSYMARWSRETGPVSKVISVNPGNAARGLPSLHALVTVLDPVDGRPVALIEGAELTTRRTAAASAVAVSLLANADAPMLAVLGSGVQAAAHVRTLARVRRLDQVRIWSPTRANREKAAAELRAELELDVVAAADASAAVKDASVVALCTSSAEPVLHARWLSPGCMVLSVGSYTESHSEVDDATLERARLIAVDHVSTAVQHAGPIVSALKRGLCQRQDLVPLADLVLGRHPGRQDPSDIVFYNSVGIGVQDAAAAWTLIDRARALGRGRKIEL